VLSLVLVAWAVGGASRAASADSPFLDGAVARIDSANRAFFAAPVRDRHNRQSTVVYRVASTGQKPEQLWTMAGWQTTAWLSDDGDFLVVGYRNVNLLEVDHAPDEVMLSFYKRGAPTGVVRLNEIMPDRARLRRTVSHYAWGNFVGFVGPHRFAIETIDDRRLVYDVTTGALVAAGPAPPQPPVQPSGEGDLGGRGQVGRGGRPAEPRAKR
jgi:hypothetical protein